MMKSIQYYLSYLIKGISPTEVEYGLFLSKIDFNIDQDYVDFIRNYNGCDGCFEEGKCILLWKIEDVIELNPYYDFIPECANLFFIGTDGSSIGYAFDKPNETIISVELENIGVDKPKVIGKTFEEFLEYLSHE